MTRIKLFGSFHWFPATLKFFVVQRAYSQISHKLLIDCHGPFYGDDKLEHILDFYFYTVNLPLLAELPTSRNFHAGGMKFNNCVLDTFSKKY